MFQLSAAAVWAFVRPLRESGDIFLFLRRQCECFISSVLVEGGTGNRFGQPVRQYDVMKMFRYVFGLAAANDGYFYGICIARGKLNCKNNPIVGYGNGIDLFQRISGVAQIQILVIHVAFAGNERDRRSAIGIAQIIFESDGCFVGHLCLFL
ncbi:MAG: hypothetical protein HZA50_05790 [Planctomycetes bacterium]|nr:hypothetical protein [Planctomycetota bacterium]